MLHLPDPGLDPGANRRLKQYQREVDAAGNYADRVTEAKRLFDSRRRNRTFRRIRETLARMCSGAQRCAYCEDSVADEVEAHPAEGFVPMPRVRLGQLRLRLRALQWREEQ